MASLNETQPWPRLAMVAGEASGDLLGAHLLQGLRGRWPNLEAHGIGGAHMSAQSFAPWWSSEKLSVRGYVEVLRHYREIVGIRDQLRSRLAHDKPDLFVGIDAPDFNLDLECKLRTQGIKTVHFICPSVWAWRPERMEKIRQAAGHVLCVFPFEPGLLQQHDIASSYVGHPLAQLIPRHPNASGARERLRAVDGSLGELVGHPVLAVLPGSRTSEIDCIGPAFIRSALLLMEQLPGLRVLLPTVPMHFERVKAMVTQAIADHPRRLSQLHLHVLRGQSHLVLEACDVALVGSGTATLEAALFQRPMVIAYRMPQVSWWIMRGKRLQPWVGLPNILSREFVVPEFLQNDCRPQLLARAVQQWFDDPVACAAVRQRFGGLHDALSRDTFKLATDAIEQVLSS
jgi:lipid-A-disaccharide synthase